MSSEKASLPMMAVANLNRDADSRIFNWKQFLKFFLTLAIVYIWGSIYPLSSLIGIRRDVTPPLGIPKKIQKHWGQYAPWFPVEKYKRPPKGCEITQVNILQRHGARYPNSYDSYDESIKRLMEADKFVDSKLDFLSEYEYDLEEEELLPFGASQSFGSGETVFRRYSHLVNAKNIPFVRSSGKSRAIHSATNWTVGFAAASHHRYNPILSVVVPEEQNNTLNNDCPNAGDGTKQKRAWLKVFAPPIAKRLEKAAPGAKVSNDDVFNLMAMCSFETLAKERGSEFCQLFKDREFKMFGYHGDVEKFYKTGYGEPLGPVQGVGYVNELLARLTGRPVQDHTQYNSSLPFPLGRSLYVDFTHENLMVAVYSAMGLFNISDNPLSTKKMEKESNRVWIASKMVPFSSRMVVERLTCSGRKKMHGPKLVDFDDEDWEDEHEHEHEESEGGGRQAGEHVRVLVNDAVQPLDFCHAGKGGICSLDAFVESQDYARRSGDGDFEKCYN
ncbi:unnamed protein product [Somion occarium]|uniref:Phytase A n=2 Tax=Somion occarium TaxID=3059160 RepID=A0ABP1DW14_9APHY